MKIDLAPIKGVARLLKGGLELRLWRVDSSRRVAGLYQGDEGVAYGEGLCVEGAIRRMLEHLRLTISEPVYLERERQVDYYEQRRWARRREECLAQADFARAKMNRARVAHSKTRWARLVQDSMTQANDSHATSWIDAWLLLDRTARVFYEDGNFCVWIIRRAQIVRCCFDEAVPAGSCVQLVASSLAGERQVSFAWHEIYFEGRATSLTKAQIAAFGMDQELIGKKLL